MVKPGFALGEKGTVVAGVGIELGGVRVDFDDGLDDGVHEVAVVGNHQNGTAVIQQVALKPEQRDQVEVVRRLVEHQQIRLHSEELGEVGAHHPTTRIFFGRLVEVFGFEAEAVEDFFGFGLELVAIERGELVLGVGKIWVG